MNPTTIAMPDNHPLEDMLRSLRRRLEDLTVQLAADPDGELAQTAEMLRLKRGCKR